MKFDPTLYLVTDSTGRTDDDFLSILEKALTGGVTLVQLREKERGGGEYLRLARLTKAVCDRYRVPLYKEASYKPYIIAAMITLARKRNPADLLLGLLEKGGQRCL